jgi:hypothetical protein
MVLETSPNTAYVLLRSGYADWEPAAALAELRRTFGFSVRTIGLTSETVVSMGGLRVIPNLTLPPNRARVKGVPPCGGGELRRVIVRTTVSARVKFSVFSEFIRSSLVAARCGHRSRPVCVAQLPVLVAILSESGKVSSFVDAMPFGVQLDFAP